MKRAIVLFVLVGSMLLAGVSPAYPASSARLVLLSTLDGPPLPEGVRILEDYDSFVLAEVSEVQLAALPQANVMDLMTDRTVISLNGNVWDTRQGEPAIANEMRSADDDPYFLVQFYGPIKMEWVTGLESLGVTFLAYWPNYTYIVRMDPALVDKVQTAHAVQWVGRYHPAYRLASDEELSHGQTDGDKLAVEVSTFAGVDARAFQLGLEAAGVTVALVETKDDGAVVARVWATREQLPKLAALHGVFRVESYDPPRLLNDAATQVMHTKYVWKASRNGLMQDLMGAGQIAGMVDSGLDNKTTSPNIEDFYDYTGGTTTSRVVYNQNAAGCGGSCKCSATDSISGHGTHVAGSMVGNGYLSLMPRGLTGYATAADPSFDYAWGAGQAPEAKIAVAHAGGTSGYICVSAQDDWTTLYDQGARATNNSWGGGNPTYEGTSRIADYVMWNYQDYLLVVSAGNDGPGADTVTPPATAKNILTVGASGNHRSVWAGDSQTSSLLTDFSSHGPLGTSGDTRFKPDIVAPGSDVLSTRTTAIPNQTVGLWQNEPGDGDSDGHLDYVWSGGTSMSGPQVTGAALIVRDYFQDIQGLVTPSAALIKAALANGAVDMGYGYEANTSAYPYGGRNMQGWGMANVEQSIMPRAPRSFFYDDFTDIDAGDHTSDIGPDGSGDYVEYTVSVADSSEPLKVTLTWTDYANATTSSYAVNNLNLTVISPGGGTTYYGNNFTGAWSNTTATTDGLNNTEAVYIQAPATGTWRIRVTLANAPTGTYQPFALFVSGGLGVIPSTSRTCSGITSCTGRMSTSAQVHYPSLKPLTGSKEHTQADTSFTTSFRVTNWGTTADTVSLSSAATTMTGATASGLTVTFSPAGPFSLASGAYQDVVATVSVGSGVATGSYDLSLTAASSGSTRKDVQVIGLNVLPDANVSNQGRIGAGTVSTTRSQVSPTFWVCPNTRTTMWAAYLSGEDHIGGGAEVYAARSTDGGVTWTTWQLDSGNGYHYYAPAIAGSADCSSVTAAWVGEITTGFDGSGYPLYSYWLYSRTYSSGAWGSQSARDSCISGTDCYLADPAVIYDNQGDILAAWLHADGTNTGTYFSYYNGTSWSTAAGVVTGGYHRYPALALDTTNNDVWMAYAYNVAAPNRDIYVKYWDGDTNAWNGANTSVAVASTTNRENHPAIGYANGKLWLAWSRYTNYGAAIPVLYYTYSTSTLPTLTWATAQGPYGTRLAEHTPLSITGDSSFAYIAYLGYTDSFRGGNIYALKVAAGTGALDSTLQLSATADDPPLYARGNAGAPRLQWATTTVNGATFNGPTLLYSKNAPDSEAPNYAANLGVAQTLYNLEENFDFYLGQLGNPAPTAVELAGFKAWSEGTGIHVEWETATEVDTVGFDLYRSTEPTGEYVKLNAVLIPSQWPGSPLAATYTWIDSDVQPGQLYHYRLDALDIHGAISAYGPVTAIAGTPYTIYLPLIAR